LKQIQLFIKYSEVNKVIKKIWAIKKSVKHYPEKPFYVFSVQLNTFTLNTSLEDLITFLSENVLSNIENNDIDIIFY
jgi:hypothetical protein